MGLNDINKIIKTIKITKSDLTFLKDKMVF